MKKTLLIGLFAISATMNSQVLVNDNYNALTLGNITTATNGTTAGQDGYFAGNGVVSDYQIVSEGGTNGNVAQITGSNTATGTRFLFKNITSLWAGRTSGNNIIDVDFDIFTGAATTSKNTARVYLYNDAGSAVAGIGLNLETKAIVGYAYYDPNNGGVNPVGFYYFDLGTAGAVINLTPNTWVKVGVSYNTTTKEVVWKGPGFYAGVIGATPATGTTSLKEIDYVHTAGTGNTVAATSKFDNLRARAVAVESLLENNNFVSNTTDFSVYPNPSNDVVNVSNSSNAIISTIEMTDLNGRVVKNVTLNATEGQINISDLSTGVYMMNVTSDQGSSIKKVVKN